MTTTKKSIVKSSLQIREYLQKRITELGLKSSDIIKDASERNFKIDNGPLSRYLKHGDIKGTLSEEQIVWLCCRYGINLYLMVGTAFITEGKLKIKLPPYNEKKALEKLKTVFPHGH